MTPQVSVVVPTYNRADLIAHTLDSVLAQSLVPHEIIVVDDGSSDHTEQVVARYAPAVRYVRQENGGVASARNHGARLAGGTWLAFTDSDDLWHPRKLEVQLAALQSSPGARWSLAGCDIIDGAGNPFPGPQGYLGVFGVFAAERCSPQEFFASYFESLSISVHDATWQGWRGDAYDALFLGNFGLPSSAVVEAAFYRELGGFRDHLRLAEETEFFHRAAAHAPVVLVDAPLVSYRRGVGGSLISPANAGRLVENALASLDGAAALRPGRSARATANWRKGRARLLRKLAWVQLTNLDPKAARASLQAAWQAGTPRDPRSLGLYAATLLPGSVLQVLRQARRASRG